MPGFLDGVSGYVDPLGNVLERHPDFGMDDVCGVLSHWVEDNFMISDVMVLFVCEGRRCAGNWLIREESVTGFRSSR